MELDIREKYLQIVEEIRKRLIWAEMLSNEPNNNFVFIESTSLQIRKILELVAYLSVLVNREKLNHKDRNEWHPEKIVEVLGTKTTIFYPLPSYMIPPNKERSQPSLIPLGYEAALSQIEFIQAYKMCGNILHAQHPLKNKLNIEKYATENKKLLNKLKNLLRQHTVGIRHGINQYTFLHVEIDFSNNEQTKPPKITGYKSLIFNEKQLKQLFNMDFTNIMDNKGQPS
ncbi:hypothetical protein [Sulfurovum sp.]|uniref:hypothetical protein n=1 Tax=Sulfurovum sp. TaxID=1969726 RepID=UPI0035625DBC